MEPIKHNKSIKPGGETKEKDNLFQVLFFAQKFVEKHKFETDEQFEDWLNK